jgi:hypothetical protein
MIKHALVVLLSASMGFAQGTPDGGGRSDGSPGIGFAQSA